MTPEQKHIVRNYTEVKDQYPLAVRQEAWLAYGRTVDTPEFEKLAGKIVSARARRLAERVDFYSHVSIEGEESLDISRVPHAHPDHVVRYLHKSDNAVWHDFCGTQIPEDPLPG